ncbi:MAG: bile acid:sodium symporter family protein [Polyangiales bacterium]
MTAIKLILTAALFAVVCAQGTLIGARDFRVLLRGRGFLLRGVLAVIVAVPVVALVVVRLIAPSRPVAVALALLSAAPLAPMALKRLAKSGEDFRVGASLHLVLAALSIVSTPLVIAKLGPALGFEAEVAIGSIARSVLVAVFVPFGVGVALHTWAPRAAERLRPILQGVGMVVIAVFVLVIAVKDRGLFLELGVRDYAAMIVFCCLALASGHLLAFEKQERTTFALESAARNPGLALLIATTSFGHVRAAAVLLPYMVVFVVISSLYLRVRSRATRGPIARTSTA